MNNDEINQFDNFIKSKDESCLVIGTNYQKKHFHVIKYLNSLNKNLRILIRIPTMQDSDIILGYKAKTGVPRKINKLSIYVDSFQSKSQEKTPREFNCIIIYPIGSLKGISDKNIIDILNYRKSEKVFWVSNHDNIDFTYLKSMCDINKEIIIDNDNIDVHNRIIENSKILKTDSFEKVEVESLSYYYVEKVISEKYNLGIVETSSLPQELVIGVVDEYILGGSKKTVTCIIKVPKEYGNDRKYIFTKKLNRER